MIDFFQHIYFSLRDILEGTYTLRILVDFVRLFISILPYFVIAILIQVVTNRAVQQQKINLKFRNDHLAIVSAALLGVLSPMPTYTAVPIALSLVRTGLPFSAAMTFMIASPLINPSVFFLTASLLGLDIAMLRLAASVLIAVAGGHLIKVFSLTIMIPEDMSARRSQLRPFYVDFYRTTLFLGKYFLVALLLSSAVKAIVPAEVISRLLGQHVGASLLVAIALGVPFYSCGGAAIPLIEVLMERGMSTAAALAFFIAGPATKLETMYIYKSMLGFKILFFYLILTGLGAYLVGVAVHFIF